MTLFRRHFLSNVRDITNRAENGEFGRKYSYPVVPSKTDDNRFDNRR